MVCRQLALCCARYSILLLYGLSGCVAAAHPLTAADPVSGYHLDELAMPLNHAPAPLRAELAQIAISELARAYTDEARRARDEWRRGRIPNDLWRWIAAVEQLAARLTALGAAVSPESVVHIGIRRGQGVYLIVDGSPVVVNGPRVHAQADLEQRVIRRFCTRNPCDELLATGLPPPSQAAADRPPAPPQWRFSEEAGPVCATDDGLELRFRDAQNLHRKRQLCTQLVNELNVLVNAITRHRHRGTRIEWDALAIHPPIGTGQQEVELNADGDFLRANLPLLVTRPALLTRLRPWLAAKVGHYPHRLVVQNADELLPRFYIPGF